MKTFVFSILVASLVLLSSCSFTKQTGATKQFSKKHYNKGLFLGKVKLKEYENTHRNETIETSSIEVLQGAIASTSVEGNILDYTPVLSLKSTQKEPKLITEIKTSKRSPNPKYVDEIKTPSSGRTKVQKQVLTSLILGGIGLFFGYIGIPIAATILGHKGVKASAENSEEYRRAKIGRTLGIIGIVFRFIALAFLIMAVFILLV